MKHTIKAHLHYSTDQWNSANPLRFWPQEMGNSDKELFIKSFDVEVDVPDDFDPRPIQIKALEEKQRKAAAEFYALTTEIKRQISELQALEFTA